MAEVIKTTRQFYLIQTNDSPILKSKISGKAEGLKYEPLAAVDQTNSSV